MSTVNNLVYWYTVGCGWTPDGTQMKVALSPEISRRIVFEAKEILSERLSKLLDGLHSLSFELEEADSETASTLTLVADGLFLVDAQEFRRTVESVLADTLDRARKDGARMQEQFDSWKAALLETPTS